MAISGALATLNYGWETGWGSKQATTDKSFGDISSFTPSIDNSMISVGGLGSQDPAAQIAGNFVGTFDMEVVCRDWWWLRGIIGDPTKGGTGPYTYSYYYDDPPDSFTMDYGVDMATDSVTEFVGCQMNTATININQGEAVTASISGKYKTLDEGTAGFTAQVAGTEDAFTFAQATLSLWGGSVTPIQSCTLTFNRNLNMIHGLGSREPAAVVYGMRTLDMTLSLPYEDPADLLDHALGSDGDVNTTTVVEPAGVTALTITNGGAGTALRSLVFTLPASKLFPKTHSRTSAPGELFVEDSTLTARGLTSVIWTNNTAAEA